jgi:hypothetical protein
MRGTWEGANDGEPWKLVIDIDCFTESEGFVVSVDTEHDDGEKVQETLIALTSEQARQVAAWLVLRARAVDDNNLRTGRLRGKK